MPALMVLLVPPSVADNLLLHSCRSRDGWHADNGGEFPGAKASTALVEDADRGTCLEGRFDFAGESRYCGVRWHGEVPRATEIGFWVKLPDHGGGSIRVQDGTGQELLGGFSAAQGQWTRVEVPLQPGSFGAHWGGANDGQLHFPLRRVLIAVSRGPDSSSLRVSNLYAVVDQPTPAERWSLRITPGVPVGIAIRGETAEYVAHVANRAEAAEACTLAVEATSLAEQTRQLGTWPVNLSGWQEQEVRFRLRMGRTGYWRLTGRLLDAEGLPLQVAPSALAVVPPARHLHEWAHDCYFGMQSIPDYEAAERLGCKAMRTAPGWRWGEPRPGDPYLREYLDGAVAGAYEHHLDILATVQFEAPGWIGWRVEGRPGLAGLPDPTRFAEVTRVARVAAEVFTGRAAAIEINNEPDLTCWMHPGLSFEEGVDYYVKLLHASREGIRQVDPDVPIAGLDVSGGDFDTGLRFTRAVLAQAADQLDLYTGHPYASPRYFGPGQNPVWPVANRMADKCREALDLFASFGRPRRMWIGELGWGLQNSCDPLSPESIDFAACVAQSLIVGKTVPGVEKHLYFTMEGCNEYGNEYGLVRGTPMYPLPAALAYAAAAHTLDGTGPGTLTQAAGDLWRATFACPERDELIVVWWTDGPTVALRPPGGAREGRWFDSFFADPRRGGRSAVGRLPVYWVLPLGGVGEQPRFLDEVRVEAPLSVSVQQVFLAGLDRVTVVLTNHTSAPQAVDVEVDGDREVVSLPPGAAAVRHEVALPRPLLVGAARDVTVGITAGGERRETTLHADVLPLPQPPPGFSADGDLGEWSAIEPLVVRDRQAVLPPDPNIGWSGPEDLSLEVRLAADDEALCLAVAVTDDVNAAPIAEGGTFWMSDSLQVALDPLNDSLNGFDDNDRELGFVLGDNGPRAYLTYPQAGAGLEASFAVVRRGTQMIYEVRIPWEALVAGPPASGRLIALNVIANENDGQGRAYWMGLTPGIGEAKAPQSYRRFVRME
jgi:hypothetical protein